MELGVFSVSLAVKDLSASQAFYEKLGFETFAGSLERNYFIMKNKETLIGLFQGMFPSNILTFNPGWDSSANILPNFQNVREIQKELKEKGVQLSQEVDANASGPGSIMLQDPDGNMILVDQHAP